MSLHLASPGFNQLHRLAVADHFAAAGFPYDNHISADVTSVYFTGFLNVYHTTSLDNGYVRKEPGSVFMSDGIVDKDFGTLQNLF